MAQCALAMKENFLKKKRSLLKEEAICFPTRELKFDTVSL